MQLKEILHRIPDYTNDTLIITNSNLGVDEPKILYVNQAFTKLTGYSEEDALGKTPRILQGPKTDRETLSKISKALKEKKPITVELLNYSKLRHEYWVELSINPVLGKNGECKYFIAIEKDITERKVMQEATDKQSIEFLNSEIRTRAILYSIVDGIVTFDLKGNIETISPSAEKIFGYDALEIEEVNIFEFFPSRSRNEVENLIEKAGNSSDNESVQLQAVTKIGKNFTAEININRIEINKKPLLVMAVRDVTELKLAQQRANKQSERMAILQEAAVSANTSPSLSEAINSTLRLISEHFWFSAGHCFIVDKATEQLVSSGVWYGEQLGKLQEASFKSNFAMGCDFAGKAWAFGKAQLIDNIYEAHGFLRSSSSLAEGINSAYQFPVYCGNEIVAVIEFFNQEPVVLDYDDQEIIYNIGCQLGQAIERDKTQKALIKAKEIAESSTKAKSEFLANMSHELRTPMNGVLGLAELLADAPLDAEQSECLKALTTSARSLLDILNDILDFSKIEAGELKLENISFSLPELINRVSDFMTPLALQKNLELTCEVADNIPSSCMGDVNRIQQILLNLVGNAVKFTKNGKVTIRAFCPEENESLLKFEVEDTGIGIPEEFQKVIFNKFTQADASTTRKYGGTGLGLAICKQLVEMMKGEIGVVSKAGEGSKFWFTVPYVPGQTQEISSALNQVTEALSLPVSKAKILVAEDHPINQMLLLKLLRKLGVKNVDVVSNGLEAIKMLDSEKYTLILMDCQMPEMDGYEATRSIREKEKETGDHVPIIAMTANAMVGDREKCLKEGMDDYISKPIELARVAQALGRWLNVNSDFSEQNISEKKKVSMPIDIDHLRNFTDGDTNEEEALFKLFLDRADSTLSDLKSSMAENDNQKWRQASHLLKGASGNLGAKKLYLICRDAENNFESDTVYKKNYINDIHAELIQIHNFIEHITGNEQKKAG